MKLKEAWDNFRLNLMLGANAEPFVVRQALEKRGWVFKTYHIMAPGPMGGRAVSCRRVYTSDGIDIAGDPDLKKKFEADRTELIYLYFGKVNKRTGPEP